MTRDQAITLLKQHIQKENLLKHMYATEACMRYTAEKLGEDGESWSLAGLLHDVDYEITSENPARHGLEAQSLLQPLSLSPDILDAIACHAGYRDRTTKIAKALFAVDPLTGLIIASALMTPTKSLLTLQPENILKRFKEKRFAAGANREQITTCSELGLSLEAFCQICLDAMQSIHETLGL